MAKIEPVNKKNPHGIRTCGDLKTLKLTRERKLNWKLSKVQLKLCGDVSSELNTQ